MNTTHKKFLNISIVKAIKALYQTTGHRKKTDNELSVKPLYYDVPFNLLDSADWDLKQQL